MNGNTERLRDAGLIAETQPPDNYSELIEGLTEDEIDVLISLKKRLEDAGIPVEPLGTDAKAQGVVIL